MQRNHPYANAIQEQQENTLTCVLNLSAAFLLQLCVVVPLSVFVLVVQNWVLGSFVCYMLPMIQVGLPSQPRSRRDKSPCTAKFKQTKFCKHHV